jgi:uncharacterized membrane protein
MLIPLIVGLVLLAIGIFLFFTTGVWFLSASIQGPICGIINIPLPNEAIGNTKYWCHSF